MTSLSLKWRISLWVSAVLVAVITTISIVAYFEFQESHLREIDRTLLVMAHGIVASVEAHGLDTRTEEEIRMVTGRSERDSSTLYRIWADGSAVDLYVSDAAESDHGRWLREIPELKGNAKDEYSFLNIRRKGGEYRVILMRHEVGDKTFNIVVARDCHFTFHETHEYLNVLLILGGSLILASIVAIMWTVRCGLLPINTTAQRIRRISGPKVDKDVFNDLKVPEELHPFVDALQNMLHRLDMVLLQQRQFSSDAAHELRTPLAGVKSTLQASQMRPRRAAEYQQAIEEALKDIGRMEHLIDQLLILAHLDETNEHSDYAEIPLDVLLSELAGNYNGKARQYGGQVIVTDSSALTIRGDLDELSRLFCNILDNAVKYGPLGGTVSIALTPEPDGWVAVCVHDEGGNIPPEVIPHLFDRFFRVDKSRSESTGGTGLGLAIAKEIAQRHGGGISITSNAGSGTLVRIRLPQA